MPNQYENIADGKIRFVSSTEQLFIDYAESTVEVTDFVKGLTEAQIRALSEPLLNKFYLATDSRVLMYYNGAEWLIISTSGPSTQIQSDWAQTDDTAKDFIKNKPTSIGTEEITWAEYIALTPEQQHDGKFRIITDITSTADPMIAERFDTTKDYSVGNYCIYENVLYKFKEAKAAGPWDSTKVEATTVADNLGAGGSATVEEITWEQYQALTPAQKNDGTLRVITNLSTNIDPMITNTFLESASYNTDDLCIYGNVLYRFITNKAAGPWDQTAVVATNVETELKRGGSGASSLATLTDVQLNAPTDGQMLVYNASLSKWENGSSSDIHVESGLVKKESGTGDTYYAWAHLDGMAVDYNDLLYSKNVPALKHEYVYRKVGDEFVVPETEGVKWTSGGNSSETELSIEYVQGGIPQLDTWGPRYQDGDEHEVIENTLLELSLTDSSTVNVQLNPIYTDPIINGDLIASGDIEDGSGNKLSELNDKIDKVDGRGTGSFAMNVQNESTIGKYSAVFGCSEEQGSEISGLSYAFMRVSFALQSPKVITLSYTGANLQTIIDEYGSIGWISVEDKFYQKILNIDLENNNFTVENQGIDYTSIINAPVDKLYTMNLVSNNAEGFSSFAEGTNTTASGYSSHAEGYGTIASGSNQHVEGKYNVEDTQNQYAYIIGNGESNSARSNAMTVDWSGNLVTTGTVNGFKLAKMTQAEYDALATKDESTLYIIVEE